MVVATSEVVYVTEMGQAALEAEVACLRRMQQDIAAEQLRCAYAVEWEMGGNQASAAEMAAIDREIGRLERVLRTAVAVAPGDDRVGVGSRVVLRGDDGERRTVGLVGPVAANSLYGWVSYESPLAKALLGRRVGDRVEVRENGCNWQGRIVELGTLAG